MKMEITHDTQKNLIKKEDLHIELTKDTTDNKKLSASIKAKRWSSYKKIREDPLTSSHAFVQVNTLFIKVYPSFIKQ